MDPSQTDAGTGSAARIVHDRLGVLTARLATDEDRVRRRLPDGVHRMRVTLRRIRSLLASFGNLYDEDAVLFLRGELTWIAGELGRARDVEVLRRRLGNLPRTPEEEALVDRIDRDLDTAESASLDACALVLESRRYAQTIGALREFVARPPGVVDTGRTTAFLRSRVRRDWKRLRRRATRASELSDHVERQRALHQVRKAAKRLRYAAEILVPAYGKGASRLARGAKRLQIELGEVQDSAVVQGRLRDLAERTGTPADEVRLVRGLLAREVQRAAAAEERYLRAWYEISRGKYRRWARTPDRIVNTHRANGIDPSAPSNPES